MSSQSALKENPNKSTLLLPTLSPLDFISTMTCRANLGAILLFTRRADLSKVGLYPAAEALSII